MVLSPPSPARGLRQAEIGVPAALPTEAQLPAHRAEIQQEGAAGAGPPPRPLPRKGLGSDTVTTKHEVPRESLAMFHSSIRSFRTTVASLSLELSKDATSWCCHRGLAGGARGFTASVRRRERLCSHQKRTFK